MALHPVPPPAIPAATARPDALRGFTVAVVGLGYVGLPTAVACAGAGARVLGVDVSAARLTAIAAGAVDLPVEQRRRLADTLGSGALSTTADAGVLREADAVLVCVPTPLDARRRPDRRALEAACAATVAHARTGQLVVLTSTTSVGSTRELLASPLEARGFCVGQDVFVATAPERIDPGSAATEPVARVVGGLTAACTGRAQAVLGALAPTHPVSSPEVAELSKLHENTFRAVNVAYALDLERAARAYRVDAGEVIDAAATKPFGFMPFRPSAGVGGHCIPCDPHYLLAPLAARGVRLPVAGAAMEAIARRPREVVQEAVTALLEADVPLPRGRVLVVGAAYKPGVADVRESAAVAVLRGLRANGVHVDYHDPLVPVLDLPGGALRSVDTPDADAYDLVVLACVHPGTARWWEGAATPVLDHAGRSPAPEDGRQAGA